MKRLNLLFISVFSLFLFTGCQTVDLSEKQSDTVRYLEHSDALWQQHLSTLKHIHAYQAQGQLGYISRKERFSSRFNWHYQNQHHYDLTLYSTLSRATLHIQMRPQGMTISDHQGNKRSERDADLLLREIIGMSLPLQHFATWLKGQPIENSEYFVGENHRLAGFVHAVNGERWKVDYLRYHSEYNGLPRDIMLSNQLQTLKIKVDKWVYTE